MAALGEDSSINRPLVDEATIDIDAKLRQMDAVLAAMEPGETAAFRLACERSPHLRTSRVFRIKFLRADDYQPGHAAHRLTQYFDTTQRLFGSETVGREIRMSHMDSDDIDALRSGGIQILPQKDYTKRCPVLFIRESSCKYRTPKNMVKAAFYMLDVLSRDTNVQKRGIVRVRYDVDADVGAADAVGRDSKNNAGVAGRTAISNKNGDDGIDANFFMLLEEMLRFASPVRIERHHLIKTEIHSDTPIVTLFNQVLTDEMRDRFFLHLASDEEGIQPCLEMYGISPHSLPIDGNRQLLTHDHAKWMASRKSADDANLECTVPKKDAYKGSKSIIAQIQEDHRKQEHHHHYHHQHHRQQQQNGDRSAGISSGAISVIPTAAAATVANATTATSDGTPSSSSAPVLYDPVTGRGGKGCVSQKTDDIMKTIETHILADSKVRFPTQMGLESDRWTLSKYQCLLRKQIEIFEADERDAETGTAKLHRDIEVGQIGLRCYHCNSGKRKRKRDDAQGSNHESGSDGDDDVSAGTSANASADANGSAAAAATATANRSDGSSSSSRQKNKKAKKSPGSIYYPVALGMLYQAAQNLANNHICTGCPSIPKELKKQLNLLRADKRRASSGKEYWKTSSVSVFGFYQHGRALWSSKSSRY